MDIEINKQFGLALDLIEKGNQSIFITGKAGTGKSTLLEFFCQNTSKKPVVLAPTGVAALNVKGQTIHSFFHFYVDVTPDKIRTKEIKPRDSKLYKKIETIIIDEVSMVRADLMDCVDQFLRLYGPKRGQPFGGVQMIFIGDLYQLPPVVTSQEKEIFQKHYQTPYFFSAHVFSELSLDIIELDKIYRQKDQRFIALLNAIRNNSAELPDIDFLNERYLPDFSPSETEDFYITLTTTNKKADEINQRHLNALSGKDYVFNASVFGDVTQEYFPTASCLRAKVGAQVMMLNNDPEKRWVNGSMGAIQAIKIDEEGERYLKIRLNGKKNSIKVYPYTWEVFHFSYDGKNIVSECVGQFIQYPIRLSWAVTIHKSQGKTFKRVIIDIGRGTFVSGQMYVALSRCTTFEGIVLKTPIKKGHIRIDYRVFDFLTRYHYQLSEARCPFDDKIKIIQSVIDRKEKLNITYLKANDTRSRRIVIPYRVGEESYCGKCFIGMEAYCTKRKEIRVFRVDRILELSPVS